MASISNRASALHSVLHGKHASLLNTRFVVSARASFDYQCKIAPGGDANKVKGYRIQTTGPVAVLHRWYSLVREKRPNRQDFLKALAKVFNHDSLEYRSSQNDVDFVRFMAENFSALDYKTQEEVLTVIRYLTNILSTTGSHILEMLSPSHLLTSIRGPMNANAAATIPPVSSSSADASTGIAVGSEGQINAEAQVHQDQQEEDEVMRAIAPPSTSAPAPSSNSNSGDDDKIPLSRTSVTIAIVMLLKAHLKTLYGLSEDKCGKFVLGKKSNIGDRPATKKHDRPISWDRLPFATKPILTSVDADEQKQTFIDIWMEDGVTAEPEDEFEAAA